MGKAENQNKAGDIMMIMTKEEITEVFKKLKSIQTAGAQDFQKQANLLNELQQSMGLNLPHTLGNTTHERVFNLTSGIHTYLQTNMILNACVSAENSSRTAKWSCKWAAPCGCEILQELPFDLTGEFEGVGLTLKKYDLGWIAEYEQGGEYEPVKEKAGESLAEVVGELYCWCKK